MNKPLEPLEHISLCPEALQVDLRCMLAFNRRCSLGQHLSWPEAHACQQYIRVLLWLEALQAF